MISMHHPISPHLQKFFNSVFIIEIVCPHSLENIQNKKAVFAIDNAVFGRREEEAYHDGSGSD